MSWRSVGEERQRWAKGTSWRPAGWLLVLACAHSGPPSEARSEWRVVRNGSQLSIKVARESEESLRLQLTVVEVCRDAEYAGRVYAEGPRYVTKGWAGERHPCAGADARPVPGALVEGIAFFERSRRALPMQAVTDGGGLATFDMRGIHAMAAYCGEGEMRFQAGRPDARTAADTPGQPYTGSWPATIRLPLARPSPAPIAEIASPKAAEIARACCVAEQTPPSVEPCSDACAEPLRAGECLVARRACRLRGGESPVALSCSEAFSVCLEARGTSRTRWDGCVSECTGQRILAACR